MAMIKLKPLLLERHQEDLYHATYESQLLDILKDDAIKMAFVGGTFADQQVNKGYSFFLSTMRSKYGNYARGGQENTDVRYNVIIHLDGRALTAAGFKTFWVDYWGMGPKASEEEERIASNNDEITPLKNFVKDVHILIQEYDKTDNLRSSYSLERLHEIDSLTQKFPFPIYFYPASEEQAFKAHRTERAIRSIKDIIPQPNWTPDELEHKKWISSRPEKESTYLRAFLDIYYDKPIDLSVHPAISVIKWLRYYPHDAKSQIAAEIHNYKKNHIPIFKEIVKAMKDGGFKTVNEFVDFVIKREQAREKERQEIEYQDAMKRLAQKKNT